MDLKNSYLMVGACEWPIMIKPPRLAEFDGRLEIQWDAQWLALNVVGARAVARKFLELALELEAKLSIDNNQLSINLSERNEHEG